MKGENVMSVFDNSKFEKHSAEAQEKWGTTEAYREHTEKTKNYSEQKWNDLTEDMDGIMAEFALCMASFESPGCARAQTLVRELQNYITENYYRCTNEILTGLGRMYVSDERFRNNIDRHSVGTAEFISRAIEIYIRN